MARRDNHNPRGVVLVVWLGPECHFGPGSIIKSCYYEKPKRIFNTFSHPHQGLATHFEIEVRKSNVCFVIIIGF